VFDKKTFSDKVREVQEHVPQCLSIDVHDDNKSTNKYFICSNIHAIDGQRKKYIMDNAREVSIRVSKDMTNEMFKHSMKEYTKDGKTCVVDKEKMELRSYMLLSVAPIS